MTQIPFVKVSLTIFIFLALIISLFPPFEFGNEKLRTLQERGRYFGIADKLPVKKYDLIFNSNKKSIVLGSSSYNDKFYSKTSFEFNKNQWKEKEFRFIRSSIDSFSSERKFLFRKPSERKEKKHSIEGYLWNTIPLEIADFPKDAINYNEAIKEYEKFTDKWDIKFVNVLDSIKKYDEYEISQPTYYLLDRKLIWSEFIVEFILAVLLSIISGYSIQRFVPGRLIKF